MTLMKRYSYPLMALLLLLFIALFYVLQGIESKQNIQYLKELRQLEHNDLRYNMELYRARFNLNSDFDQLVNVERLIEQLLVKLSRPPTYIDDVYQLSIQNITNDLTLQYQDKFQYASQFKTAKALYSNSARYLPQLHLDVEALSKQYQHPLVDEVHSLAQEVLTYTTNRHGDQEPLFLKQIHSYMGKLENEFSDKGKVRQMLHALLRHMELIISNLPSMREYLNSASDTSSATTITHLREIYLAGYKQQQARIKLATQLLGLFTLTLLTALLFAFINLRRTQDKLEQSNLRLESRVIERTAELTDAKAYAENITASMSEALLVTGIDGKLRSCNSAAEKLIGYSATTLQGHTLETYINGPLLTSEYQSEEGELQDASSKTIPVQISRSTLLDSNQNISGYTFVIHDLTERKHAEEQRQFLAFQSGLAEMGISVMHNIGNIVTGITGHLQQSQKINRLFDRTAQTFAHFNKQIEGGINNPQRSEHTLTTLLENSQTVLEKSATLIQDNHEKLQQQLEQIELKSHQIGALIKLHEQDSKSSQTEQQFTLRSLIENVLTTVSPRLETHQIRTETAIPPNFPAIALPRNQLMQMIIHLIENSVDAIIERNHAEADRIIGQLTIQAQQAPGGRWCLNISDNGCGIPERLQHHIFNLGFSTGSEKAGYGLHSAVTFAQSRNGSIEVESGGENQGSRFSACFPL